MFGLGYARPRSTTELVETYLAACALSTPTLIEVRTDREENVALHRELLEQLSEGIAN
jgi:2-succinyl-5-enolpyruvyl-6-hydroxy-3-cyclohexene-1-carboxylate synthase